MRIISLLLLLCFGATLYAARRSDFTDRCLPCDWGYIELEVALLPWKVSTPGLYIGTLNSVGESNVLTLRTKSEPGVRFAARYISQDQCRYLGFSWTHFDRLTEERDYTAPEGSIIQTPIGTRATDYFETNFKFEYNGLELVVGQRVLCHGCLGLDLFAGLGGARIMQRAAINYRPDGAIRSRVVYEGLGLVMGTSLQYTLGCGFSLKGSGAFNYLLGERKWDTAPRFGQNPLAYPRITEWVPAFLTRGAVRWDFGTRAFTVALELGYELRHYANVFLSNVIAANTDLSFAKDFTLSGPFFAVKVRF